MQPIAHLRPMALSAALTLALGCAPSPPPGRVYVVDRPPPLRTELIPIRPGLGYVWLPGYWSREPRGYVWVTGRYEAAPARHRAWVPGRWQHDRGGWYYTQGHWR